MATRAWTVTVSWPASGRDLDLYTTLTAGGQTTSGIGWGNGGQTNAITVNSGGVNGVFYLCWNGDNTGDGGSETLTVYFDGTLPAGDVQIATVTPHCNYYRGGSGSATVSVSGQQGTYTVSSPSTHSGRATAGDPSVSVPLYASGGSSSSARIVTVTLDAGSGKVSPTSVTYLNPTSSTRYGSLPTPTTSLANYHFAGWYTETSSQGVLIGDATTLKSTNNHTVYAKYELNPAIHTFVLPNSSAGTATGAGYYAPGSTCTLRATPKSGWVFVKWTRGAGESFVSSSPTYSFTVTGADSYNAHFAEDTTYTVSASVSGSGGTVSVSGGTQTGSSVTVRAGTTVTVTATPASGYVFDYWEVDGSRTSHPATYSFAVGENTSFVAHFGRTYTITTEASPADDGTVSTGGTYVEGTSVTLTASPGSGVAVAYWQKNGVTVSGSEGATSLSITVDGDALYTVVFERGPDYRYTISASPASPGSGTVSGGGYYTYGTHVTLTATPNPRFLFLFWITGDNVKVPGSDGQTSLDIIVTGDAVYQAVFLVGRVIAVVASPSGAGTVSGGGTYEYGATTTLTATPNSGYRVAYWEKDGSKVSGSDFKTSLSIDVIGDATYTAVFEIDSGDLCNISVNASPLEGGTASGGGTYANGATATLTATPNSGYGVAYWQKDGSKVSGSDSQISLSITVTGDATYTAVFGTLYYISVASSPLGRARISGGSTYYAEGASVTLTATPSSAGWGVAYWEANTVKVPGSDNQGSITFTVTKQDWYTVVMDMLRTITVVASPSGGGTVSGGGTYAIKSSVTLTATPNSGYRVAYWEKDGSKVSGSDFKTSLSIDVIGDATYTAVFQRFYTITTAASPAGRGTTSGGGTYASGARVTLTATSNYGYGVAYWTKDGTKVSGSDGATTLSVTVTADAAYTAVFEGVQVSVTFDANGGTLPSGTQNPKTVTYGAAYGTLPTPTRSGYVFDGWYTEATGGTHVTENTTVGNASSHILYAQWKLAVTVTFDGNGGTPSSETETYIYGEPYGSLPTAARSGFAFAGWYTEAEDGTHVQATDNAGDYTTLYAHWQPLVVVTFDGNGGTPSESSHTYVVGEEYGTLPAATQGGYTFDGWYTDPTDGDLVTTTTTVSDASPYTLYAHWTEISEVTVIFNGNGGTPSSQTQTYPVGSAYGSFPSVSHIRYPFIGWYTESSGGTRIWSSDIVSDSQGPSYELYAQWAMSSTVTVTFHGQEGEPDSQTGIYQINRPYASFPPVRRPGYTFNGWYTTASGGTHVEKTRRAQSSIRHLYARWSANTISVTLDANGGTLPAGTQNPKSVTYDAEYGVLPESTRTGYTFAGWYTNQTGGTQITENTTVSNSSDHTLYAHWAKVGELIYDEATGRLICSDSGQLIYHDKMTPSH